jgi:hypothetical protein
MIDADTLTHLFNMMDKPGLLKALAALLGGKDPVPLSAVLDILDETTDIELIAVIIELLLFRIDDVGDALMTTAYNGATAVLKRHIVMVLATAERSVYMQFLLDEYFYAIEMRPVIRQCAFKNKKFLLMNLARYFEDAAFNTETVETAMQLLRMIPRDVVLSCRGVFSGTRLMDVYYAMPVRDREGKK